MATNFLKRFISGTVAAIVVGSSIPLVDRPASAAAYPEGFVYADNGKFMCDGAPYYYGGTNCYYLTYKSDSEVKNVFDNAQEMGLKVIRVWGNLDVGKKTGETDGNGHPVFEGNNDGEGQKDGIYFQYWDDEQKKPVVNDGADGLQKLDYVIKEAEEHDMKLIITFTNYWEAFGGMGQYVKWLQMKNGESVSSGQVSGSDCCKFYTDETLKGWYKDYIKALLNHENHYTKEKLMNSEAVFAWELSNEPRCGIDKECGNDILYNWASEMSAYVKSLDPYHMVSVGDEGFFNWKYEDATAQNRNHYVYAGAEGVDFEKLMSIENIDFGTPHMYMEDWGVSNENGDVNWITDHAEVAAAVNKPVIMEEFGEKDRSARDKNMTTWLGLMVDKYQGFNYWMIASYLDDGTLYEDYDHYTVYGPEGTETDSTRTIIMDAAAKMAKKNLLNFTDKSNYDYDRSVGKDVTIKMTIGEGTISGVEFNGNALTSSDYTIEGTTIYIKDSFLKKQELGKYSAKILMTAGNSPKFTVTTMDPTLEMPEISPTEASVDINPKVCNGVAISMDKKTSEFRGLVYNGEKLTEDVDYTVDGNVVKINASFLRTLSTGKAEITFDFYEGADCILKLTISDSTGKDELDTFEKYADDDALWKAYSKNSSGNEVGLSLVTKNGSKKLAFDYNVGSPNYCGVNHPIAARDLSAFDGIKFEIEGNDSGNSFTLQLKDINDNYFEKEIKVDFTGVKEIKVPFEEFTPPSWQTNGAKLDTTKINQFSFYAGTGDGQTTTGTYYLDDVLAYGAEPVVDPYIVNKTGTYDGNDDVTVNLVLNDNQVKSVSYNDKELTNNGDYTVDGNRVILKNEFLATLENGTHKFVFKFSNDSVDTFTLTVNKGGDHTHKYTSEVTKAATCTEKGIKTFTCECGDTYTEVIPAKGHTASGWIVDKQPTNKESGSRHTECTVCGTILDTETIAPLPGGDEATVKNSSKYITVKNGSVEVKDGAKVKVGDTLTITVFPNIGWKVASATVNGKAITTHKGNVYTYKVVSDGTLNIAAKFAQMNANVVFNNKYFTVKKGNTVLNTGDAVKGGDTLSITVRANVGWKVANAFVNGNAITSRSGNTFTYKVNSDGDLKLTVKYTQMNAKVTFSSNYLTVKNGSTTLKTGDAVKGGDTLTITARVNTGWKVANVTVNDKAITSRNGNTFTYKVDSEGTLKLAPKYTQMNAKVAFNSNYLTVKKGSTVLKTGNAVKGGDTLTITARVNTGWKVANVTVNGKAVTSRSGNTFTYKVDSEGTLNLAVKYTQKTAKLNNPKTFITVKKGTTVLKTGAALKGGDTLTITVTPNKGFKVTDLTINGVVVNATRKGNVFTYKVDVEGTCTVGAKFTKV